LAGFARVERRRAGADAAPGLASGAPRFSRAFFLR
jgi:hypothetical protein